MNRPHIVSFLPSATEIACALGLTDQLVGITHECDYPPAVKTKPVVVRKALPIETMTQREIDEAVSQRMQEGKSLYEVDENLLARLAPDLILTQDLCQVCAPSGNEVTHALNTLENKPRVLWLTPNSIDEIFENVMELGEVAGCLERAQSLVADGRARLAKIERVTKDLPRRTRVFCIEWIDPIYCSGHWVPEMVRIAGGIDSLSKERADSVRVPWQEVVEWQPEVLVVTPCGYDLEQTIDRARQLFDYENWYDLPAVKQRQVYAVDANSYFARPGPRVVDGTELLAHLIHPELFEWNGPTDAFRQIV